MKKYDEVIINNRLNSTRDYACEGQLVRAAYSAGGLAEHVTRMGEMDSNSVREFLADLYLCLQKLEAER